MRHPHHPLAPHPNRTIEHWLLEPDWPLREVVTFAHHLPSAIEGVVPVLAGLALVTVVAAALVRAVQRRRLPHGARLIQIGVPPEVDPKGALLLWSALHDLLRPRLLRLLQGQPHLAWEIAASEAGSTFRLWVPDRIPRGLVERAVSSAWPGASVTTAPAEDDIQRRDGVRLTNELVLSGPDWFALDSGCDPDPLPLILGQLSGIEEGERVLVQVIARPATIREQHRLRAAARRIRAGIPTGRLRRLVEFLCTSRAPTPPRHDPTITPDVSDVMAKSSQSLYRCLIRVTVAAPSRGQARGRIHAVLSGFAAYEGRVGLRRRHVWRAQVKLRERRLGRRGFLLSTGELAALCHLPSTTGIPGLVRAAARRLAPALAVPRTGRPLGLSDSGPSRPIALSVPDGRHHLHVLGATGAGKSTALAQLVLADAHAGRGAIVIDPKGDLADWILARLEHPPEPLVVIDPERADRPVGLNVLHGPDPQLAAEHLVGTFRRMYEQFWGPRTDDILRACVLTLARDERLTLAEIPTCLANSAWRAPLTAGLAKDDPVLAGFWRWYDELSDASRVQAIGPLLNKLRAFLLRHAVRAIVGQEHTTFPLTDVLDKGLLLARLPKGTLGEDTSRLLGGLLLARVWQEAMGRSRVPEHQRPDCCLYVDEVHNYLALPHSFEDLLAEARGYRLSLCLAHQNLAQLPRGMAEAISANARTKLIFNCSPEDARILERHVSPELAAHDLANLARHQAACRTLADGQDLPAFTLQTEALPEGDEQHAQELRRLAERSFGRDPQWVQRRLRARQLRVLSGGKQRADNRHDRSLDGSRD